LYTGDFERRMKGALGMESLTLKRPRERVSRGRHPLLGTLEDVPKKPLGMGISIGAPLQLRTWKLEVGLYTGDFERYMTEGSSNGASLSERLHEGDLKGGLLYWGPP
jgi:hypothetical protein